MNRSMNLTRGPLIALAFAVLTTGAAVAVAADVTDQNVAERIASAKTAEDHHALAAYFKGQAAAAAGKVKEHEAMLASWQKTTAGGSLEVMRQHCKSAIAAQKKLQKDYEALAEAQEQAAKKAGAK